jgi:hypothetical protein
MDELPYHGSPKCRNSSSKVEIIEVRSWDTTIDVTPELL